MYLHLDQLKKRILPTEQASATRFDDLLEPLAKGVADLFDRHTGRRLTRQTGRTLEVPGGIGAVFLDCYPVEQLTALEVRFDDDDSFTDLDFQRLNERSGIVHLLAATGDETTSIRATWDGGYWVDTSADLSGSLPSGATAMPDELIDAWVLQVDHEARIRRVFGRGNDETLTEPHPAPIELAGRVAQTLAAYRRMA